jgi:hypothetical protein
MLHTLASFYWFHLVGDEFGLSEHPARYIINDSLSIWFSGTNLSKQNQGQLTLSPNWNRV